MGRKLVSQPIRNPMTAYPQWYRVGWGVPNGLGACGRQLLAVDAPSFPDSSLHCCQEDFVLWSW